MQKNNPFVRTLAALAGVAALGTAEAAPRMSSDGSPQVSISAPKAQHIQSLGAEQAPNTARGVYLYLYTYIPRS